MGGIVSEVLTLPRDPRDPQPHTPDSCSSIARLHVASHHHGNKMPSSRTLRKPVRPPLPRGLLESHL